VWYENNRSIAAKFAFARAHGFAGIAIWVLGYDSTYPDLWDLMRGSFQK
jgi:spore germination protein YaaH